MSGIEKLLVTVAKLRDPETVCPWDIEQRTNHHRLLN